MSWKDSDEITFNTASSCFSEEEWMLLQEWQKELYRKVMKEIHQALISLGPLIATTVCSLRAKEDADLCCMGNQDAETKHRINHSSRNAMVDPDEIFRINKAEPLERNPQDCRGEKNDCLSTGFPFLNSDISLRKEESVSIFIDHLGAEIGESNIDPNSGHEVVSFCIKDETETFRTDHQESKRRVAISGPTGNKPRKRRSKAESSDTFPVKAAPYKIALDNINIFHGPENQTHYNTQMWPDIAQEVGGSQTSVCGSGFGNTANFNIYQETTEVQRAEINNDWESNQRHSNLAACSLDIHRKGRLYSCNECEKSFSRKSHLIQHKKIHTGVRPYQCTDCDKSFSRKEHLIVHRRTHTGVRPYACSVCGKRFTQMGVLIRHHRTHTLDRPFHCNLCEKIFSRKGNLITHQKTHAPRK